MQVQLRSTDKIVTVNGVPARLWEGTTESGIPFIALITRIAVRNDQDTSQFEAELQEHPAPSVEAQAFPLRMII